ncbi:hypothetical protein ABZ891_09530 [Streptomyces sp. NPDC047023]|uniref:hypothetical protein n=1 Tax=Streptomyces sp. NPDC047023 TaxID=3155139 RepID=UPI0033F5F312
MVPDVLAQRSRPDLVIREGTDTLEESVARRTQHPCPRRPRGGRRTAPLSGAGKLFGAFIAGIVTLLVKEVANHLHMG